MIISKNSNGWSISTEGQNGLWHLIFDDNSAIALFESIGQTSTQLNLFVGTKEQCDAKIDELGLFVTANESLNEVQQETIPLASAFEE